MLIDGVIEADDHEFGSVTTEPLVEGRHVSLRRIEQECQLLHTSDERRLEVCIAAADLCGMQISDFRGQWLEAWRELVAYHTDIHRQERIRLPEQCSGEERYETLTRSDWIFGELYHAAIRRWNDAIAAEIEEEFMATTTRKTTPPAEQVVALRIEKRLKITATIVIAERSDGWSYDVSAEDAKQGYDLQYQDSGYDCEAAVLKLSLDRLWDWLVGLRRTSPSSHGYRISTAADQVRVHARQLVPDWSPPDVPETQDEAAAKEAAIDEPALVVGHRPADCVTPQWICGECDGTVSADLAECPWCRHAVDRQSAGGMDLSDDELAGPTVDSQGVRMLMSVEVAPSPDNPRQRFDAAALKELAASIKLHGLLQPILVCRREHDPDSPLAYQAAYEIIDGERRYRACGLAKLAQIPCRVLEVTQAQAIELRGVANLEREDLSPIEEALWLQQLLQRTEYSSQRKLAKRIGRDQSWISKRLALLTLPEPAREALIQRRITPNHAELLVPWRDRPEIVADVLSALPPDSESDAESISARDLESIVGNVARERSREIGISSSIPPAVIEEHRVELDIRPVPSPWGGTVERAFNADLADRLSKEAKKAARAEAKADKKKPRRPTKSDKSESQPSRYLLEQAAGRWWSAAIAERVPALKRSDQVTPLRLLLTLLTAQTLPAVTDDAEDMAEVLGVAIAGHSEIPSATWSAVREAPAKDLAAIVRRLVLAILRADADDRYYTETLPLETLREVGASLGVDPRGYRPGAATLDLYDEQTLRDLPAAERIRDSQGDDGREWQALSKPDLIEVLLEHWQPGEFPPGLEEILTA